MQPPQGVRSGWKPIAFHSSARRGRPGDDQVRADHERGRAQPARARRAAASGSTHSTYHGSTQLSVSSSATLAQPAGGDRVAPALGQHTAREHGDEQHRAQHRAQRFGLAAGAEREPDAGWAR